MASSKTLALPELNPYSRRGEKLSKTFVLSFAFHLLIVLAFTLQSYVFSDRQPMIIENAVRVDLVALPDKITPGSVATAPPPKIKEPEQKVAAKPEPVAPKVNIKEALKKVDDSKNKKRQEDALKKLKEMDAIDKLKSKMEAEERMQKAVKTFKGNQLSSGTELKGLTAVQHDNYVAEVKHKIYANWALPQWLAHKQLAAQVVVQINAQGHIVGKKIFKSSGNPSYDDAVLESVEKSSPLPVPPVVLAKILANEGILIGFPE